MALRSTGNAFGVDHVVAGELDVEEFQFFKFAGVMQRDRGAVDQVAHRHQDIVDQQSVRPGDEQIGMRQIGAKGRAGDANGGHILGPCLGRIGFRETIAADPLDGLHPAENGRQQIAGDEILDLPVAVRGADRGAPEEAIGA